MFLKNKYVINSININDPITYSRKNRACDTQEHRVYARVPRRSGVKKMPDSLSEFPRNQ
jgi:hypothetical protein